MFRNSSWKTVEKVLEILDHSRPKFRHRTSFRVGDKYYSERQFTYYAEKLCVLGVAEKKLHSRGWFAWTTYKLKMSSSDAWHTLTGLPF